MTDGSGSGVLAVQKMSYADDRPLVTFLGIRVVGASSAPRWNVASTRKGKRRASSSETERLLLPDLPGVKRLLKRLLGGRDESKRFAQMPARQRIEGLWIHVVVG